MNPLLCLRFLSEIELLLQNSKKKYRSNYSSQIKQIIGLTICLHSTHTETMIVENPKKMISFSIERSTRFGIKAKDEYSCYSTSTSPVSINGNSLLRIRHRTSGLFQKVITLCNQILNVRLPRQGDSVSIFLTVWRQSNKWRHSSYLIGGQDRNRYIAFSRNNLQVVIQNFKKQVICVDCSAYRFSQIVSYLE